jgi:hypothetical protein
MGVPLYAKAHQVFQRVTDVSVYATQKSEFHT